MIFETTIEVRWSDIDQNRHVRHSAYYDYGAHTRIRFFVENNFGSDKMAQYRIGPIIFKEECTFLKELTLNDTIRVNVLKGEYSDDFRKWTLHHEIFNQKNEKCAHLTLNGAWMDLVKRKLTIPPKELQELMASLDDGEHFVYKK